MNQLAEKITPADLRSYCRSILIVSGTKLSLDSEIQPHRLMHARRLESVIPIVRDEKPDLVVIFLQGRDIQVEEAILTWMIEGFRGRVVLMDTGNRLSEGDADILRDGQVVDDIHSGPTTTERFLTILRSHLGQLTRAQSPRSLMTFDLFHSLFERGINAVFFFTQDLKHCLAANMAAEQLTGQNTAELRKIGLEDLCEHSQVETTLQTVRRSSRHYYDMKGFTAIRSKSGRRIDTAFSVSWLSFGRQRFLKMEVQTPPGRRSDDPQLIDRTTLLAAVDQSFRDSQRSECGLSLVLFDFLPTENGDSNFKELESLIPGMHRIIEDGIRKSDRAIRMKKDQIGLLLPKTNEQHATLVAERLKKRLDQHAEMKKKGCSVVIKVVPCPPEAFAFMDILNLSRG